VNTGSPAFAGDDSSGRHCEEHFDEAIQSASTTEAWIASLRSQ
jgi:hypothetical protein